MNDIKLAIEPNFFPGSNDFYFSYKKLNKFQQAEYQDTFGHYQSRYRIFQYMQMNRRNEYEVTYPKGQPLVWQPYSACSYDNTGSLSLSKRSLTPDPIYMREEMCHDVLMDSCFEHMLQYGTSGDITLDAEGERIFQALLDELMINANLGFRISAVSGQLYDVDAVTPNPENTADITSLFRRTHGTVKGVLKVAYDMARIDKPWMDLDLVADTEFDADGVYTGDPVDLVESLINKSRKPLKQISRTGGVIRNGMFTFMPLLVVSDGYYASFIEYYNAESNNPATNRMRITRMNTAPAGADTPVRELWYDDIIPIVPLSEITGFDDYISGNTNFIALVGSGNLQIGASFSRLPDNLRRNDIGLMVARNDDITRRDYGTYVVLSHALAKTAIADADYFTGCINYTVPA